MKSFKNIYINESYFDSDKNGKRWEDYETIVCPDGQVIDMIKLLEDQLRAKSALVHLAPMFSGIINNLHVVYTFKFKTQATDGYHLFVNPLFTYNMDLTEKVFVMAHELMHCLLNHMRRGKGHDRNKSNIAADYECNITIADMGLISIDTMKRLHAYVDEKYRSMGYESIYKDCTASSNGSQNNKNQSKLAGNNSNQNQSSGGGSSSGSGENSSNSNNQNKSKSGKSNNKSNNKQQKKAADYKAGWALAMEDYKNGKLKF